MRVRAHNINTNTNTNTDYNNNPINNNNNNNNNNTKLITPTGVFKSFAQAARTEDGLCESARATITTTTTTNTTTLSSKASHRPLGLKVGYASSRAHHNNRSDACAGAVGIRVRFGVCLLVYKSTYAFFSIY
jgi:hypothetical protein